MAEYKYLDEDHLLYYNTKLLQKIAALYVPQTRKVNNKALSSDITLGASDVLTSAQQNAVDSGITTALVTKLNGIATGAQVNVLEGITVNGTAATVTNKIAAITVPTATSDLTNDSDFVEDANYVHTDNNFTTTLKNKLNGIAAGAEVNVQSDWTQTSTTADDYIKNKPTALSQFTNDSGFQTSTQVQSAINSAISGITGIEFSIVTTLPTTGRTGTIYLVSHNGTAPEVYDEYIWLSGSSTYEKIGTTAVDLSGYVQASEMVAITNTEIDTILAS